MLSLESHIENPEASVLFNQFPNFASDHHAVEFFCDYLRLMTLGTDNPLEVESLIDQELDVHHEHLHEVAHAVNTMAEGFPGLGIVAAVLGVIHTMGSINEPPEARPFDRRRVGWNFSRNFALLRVCRPDGDSPERHLRYRP